MVDRLVFSSFEAGRTRGEMLRADDEFVQVETHKDTLSVMWSTQLGFQEAIEPILDALRLDARDGMVEWQEQDAAVVPADFVPRIHSHSLYSLLMDAAALESMTYAQVDFAPAKVTWSQIAPKFSDQGEVYGQIGLTLHSGMVAHALSSDDIDIFSPLETTGTSEVAESSRAALGRSAILASLATARRSSRR